MKDEKGHKYGRLRVMSFSHVDRNRKPHWNCECDCGNNAVVVGPALRSGHTQSCGCLRRDKSKIMCQSRVGERSPLWGKKREKHPNWKGGRITDNDGYIKVRFPKHPRSDSGGYVLEHILVAEQALGEYIPKGHVIHHINGNRSDNRIENLWWFPSQAAHMEFHHTQGLSFPDAVRRLA